MASLERPEIERKIRELSLQIRQESLAQQKQGNIQHINLPLLEGMLEEWDKLANYYENNIFERNLSEDIDTDTEMSLFIVANYLRWIDSLQIRMTSASKNGDRSLAEELDEAISTLEAAMKRILAAASDKDDLKL